MKTENIIEFYSNYSEQYDEKIGTLSQYNQSYIDFVNKAVYKRNLLDIACGPANVSMFIKSLLTDIDITCVDLSEKMLEIAKSKLKVGTFYKSDMLNIQIPPLQYDLIVCAFGLPYINSSQVNQFVSQLYKFTHSESIVYVSCMQGETSGFETMSFANGEEAFVNQHSKHSIEQSFINSGYTLIGYQEQDYLEHNGTITIDMIFNFKRTIKNGAQHRV
jgi:ubiquinone/menaquinone biosynthesis C-methylase UbiE